MLFFVEEGKPDYCTRRKTLIARREPRTNSTHIWHRARIEPGPYWWEMRALPTVPSQFPLLGHPLTGLW